MFSLIMGLAGCNQTQNNETERETAVLSGEESCGTDILDGVSILLIMLLHS
ncbi:MAG: hypothetical protein Q4F83_13755 [Eubacteriales bacterium]|nr:hypothetical protein [Eubacteriales bacterium]